MTSTPQVVASSGRPLLVVGGNGVAVEYLPPATRGYASQITDASISITIAGGSASAPPVLLRAASGDVEGNGTSDVVAGVRIPYGRGSRTAVDVYRAVPGQPPHRIAEFCPLDGAGGSTIGDLAVGDVDPAEPGDEIIVREELGRQRMSRLRVLGGLAHGDLRVLHEVSPVPARASHSRFISLVLGNVLLNGAQAGKEIVVGDRGAVSVYGVSQGRIARLLRFNAFPDVPQASSRQLAVGDVLPENPGEEIIVADDATRGDGLVRVFDGRTGTMLLEFEAFEAGAAPAGVDVWAADVVSAFPGTEVIVGQGSAGGRVRIFAIAAGIPQLVAELTDPLRQTTNLRSLLAVGDLLPDLPGNELALAQSDPQQPVRVYNLNSGGSQDVSAVDVSGLAAPIRAIAVGR